MYRDVRLEVNSDLETRVDIIHGSRLLEESPHLTMTSKLVMTIEIQPWRGNYEIQTFACETRLFAFHHHHHSKHRPPRGRRGRREDCRRCSILKVRLWVDLSRATSTSPNGDQQGDHTKSSHRIEISSEIKIRIEAISASCKCRLFAYLCTFLPSYAPTSSACCSECQHSVHKLSTKRQHHWLSTDSNHEPSSTTPMKNP